MSTAQKFAVGLFYAAIAGLGAAYAVFEHHQANRLVHFVNEIIPSFLILILVFFVYGLFRTAVSVLKELNGVSRAAHATLHMDYGKK
jgi:membrane associated rhomboid family serine protease